MKQTAILLHRNDNVATALTALHKGEQIQVTLDDRTWNVLINEEIAFGHKFALHPLAKGEPVLKYGLPIGKALAPIQAGDWVHVHNCRSERFGSRHERYGIIA